MPLSAGLSVANADSPTSAEDASTSTPDLPLMRLVGPHVQLKTSATVAAPANSKSTDHQASRALPHPTGPRIQLRSRPSQGDDSKPGPPKITLNANSTSSSGTLPATETETVTQTPTDRVDPSAEAKDEEETTAAAKEPGEDGQVIIKRKKRNRGKGGRGAQTSAAYEFTLAEDSRLLALWDQACAASALLPNSTSDHATVSLNWPQIARDQFPHANSLQTTLTPEMLQERLNHLMGRRIWLAERAKAYTELEESIAAERKALTAAEAAAASAEPVQQETSLPPETVSPPPKPANATSADPTESSTTLLLATHSIALQPLDPARVIDSCEQMNALAARLKSRNKMKRSISAAEAE